MAEMELESSSPTTGEPTRLLEELSEGVSTTATTGEAAGERVSTLASGGIVRVVAVVEPLAELWFTEYFVGFVHRGHLGFAATLVRMCLHGCFPAD